MGPATCLAPACLLLVTCVSFWHHLLNPPTQLLLCPLGWSLPGHCPFASCVWQVSCLQAMGTLDVQATHQFCPPAGALDFGVSGDLPDILTHKPSIQHPRGHLA